MNEQIITSYLDAYKENFTSISKVELYKWQAVKQFRENWDIDAKDFYTMAKNALSKVKNLMDAGRYFPKRMLLKNCEKSPEQVRQLFKYLFDEEEDIVKRIQIFEKQFTLLNTQNFSDKKHYQDHRAIIVYLTLKFPERYFFYKFGMFKSFVEKMNYDYKAIAGRIENVSQYLYISNIIKQKLTQDQELIHLHNQRLTENCYIDTELNILTQDFIYSVVQHIPTIDVNGDDVSVVNSEINIETVSINDIQVSISDASFTPNTTNHIQNNIENKRLGNLGELFVLDYERKQLRDINQFNLEAKVSHDAATIGDGLGYDILSFDANGNKKYIEVKTTKGTVNTLFYITRTEMERSRIEKDNYYLYRVYNFNDKTLKGDIQIIKGEISKLCIDPVNFKVKMLL